MDWKVELKNILNQKSNVDLPENFKENKLKCDALFSEIVNPTLEKVKTEIGKYDREVNLTLASPPPMESIPDGFEYHYLSTIHVDYNGGTEYYFNIVCRLETKVPELMHFHFEGNHEMREGLRFEDITKEKIIKFILETYK